MALVLLSEVESATGCVGFVFEDTTGVYNVSTNPGGYGTPNPESNDISGATISFYPPLATVPYLFTFTIETGNLATATVTAPDGTVTNILLSLSGIGFPFTGDDVLNILPEWLGFEEDAMVTDGVWTSYYTITTEEDVEYNTTTYPMSICSTACCVQKMFVNLKSCDCGEGSVKALSAETKLKAAVYAANLGMMTAAQENLDKASEICSQNCTNC